MEYVRLGIFHDALEDKGVRYIGYNDLDLTFGHSWKMVLTILSVLERGGLGHSMYDG